MLTTASTPSLRAARAPSEAWRFLQGEGRVPKGCRRRRSEGLTLTYFEGLSIIGMQSFQRKISEVFEMKRNLLLVFGVAFGLFLAATPLIHHSLRIFIGFIRLPDSKFPAHSLEEKCIF